MAFLNECEGMCGVNQSYLYRTKFAGADGRRACMMQRSLSGAIVIVAILSMAASGAGHPVFAGVLMLGVSLIGIAKLVAAP